jgi:hypothetical protein
MTWHSHTWRFVAQIDGCHWQRFTYTCPGCGAWRSDTVELDLTDDGFRARANGGCGRCRYLLAGGERFPRESVIRPGRGMQ